MAESIMKYGARKGKKNSFKRLISSISCQQIRIFPIPGADILRTWQTRSDHSFVVVSSAREANVLLVVGDLSKPLRQKAAITYIQIPRPRVLVYAGSQEISPLPHPDIHVLLKEDFLEDVLPKAKELLKDYSWIEDAEPWQPDFLKEIMEDSRDDSGGHEHHNHGEGAENHESDKDDKSHEDHDSHNHNHKHKGHKHNEMDADDEEEGNHQHDHGEHDHEGHDHGNMDFMSMVEMTKDLPRPKDGLPMNRSEVHFGPFHPGLPGGLSIFTELDGDTVINAHVEHDMLARSLEENLPLEVKKLPGFIRSLNPLCSETFELLAHKALDDKPDVSFNLTEVIRLENDRVLSHLNWLAVFAKTFGNNRLSNETGRWYKRHKEETIRPDEIHSFLDQFHKMPYLKKKLRVGPGIPDKHLHHLSGPVAKAAGMNADVRSDIKLYQELGWEPITKNENNPWGRLLVRIDEIEQSLRLIEKAGKVDEDEEKHSFKTSGNGSARLESPRGHLSMDLNIKDGKVTNSNLTTPSAILAGLIAAITEEMELSDALVQISSLDISPWEIQVKRKGGVI